MSQARGRYRRASPVGWPGPAASITAGPGPGSCPAPGPAARV